MTTEHGEAHSEAHGDLRREETPRERTTRRWNEMLQELRVAQTGVQVLTGFLLTVPFTQRFGDLDPSTKYAYLVTMCASARVGLAMLGLTMSGVMFVVFDLVAGRLAAVLAGSVTACVLVSLWLVVPKVGDAGAKG